MCPARECASGNPAIDGARSARLRRTLSRSARDVADLGQWTTAHSITHRSTRERPARTAAPRDRVVTVGAFGSRTGRAYTDFTSRRSYRTTRDAVQRPIGVWASDARCDTQCGRAVFWPLTTDVSAVKRLVQRHSSWFPLIIDDQLRTIRRELGLTQAALAQRIGAAGKAVIYQWESRKRKPSPILWRRVLELRT